jgi:hypothetical protein
MMGEPKCDCVVSGEGRVNRTDCPLAEEPASDATGWDESPTWVGCEHGMKPGERAGMCVACYNARMREAFREGVEAAAQEVGIMRRMGRRPWPWEELTHRILGLEKKDKRAA